MANSAPAGSSNRSQCFVCGGTEIASQRQAQRLYQKQADHYKKLILGDDFTSNLRPFLAKDFEQNENCSCADCLSSIKQVWDLYQQIEAIQQDISDEIEKARNNLMLRNPIIKKEIDADVIAYLEPKSEELYDEEEQEFNIEDLVNNSNEESPGQSDGARIADLLDNNLEEEDITRPKHNQRPARQSSVKANKSLKQEDEDVEMANEDNDETGNSDSNDQSDSDEDYDAQSNLPQPSSQPFKCPSCDRTFKTKRYMVIHIQRVHLKTNTLPKKEQCSKCLKFLRSRKNLLVHQVIVCQMEVNPKELMALNITFINCDQCPKKFFHKKDYKRHYTTHTGEKQFSCPKCLKRFNVKSACIKHQKLVCLVDEAYKKKESERHQITKQKKPFKCSKCFNRRFETQEQLEQHKGECSMKRTTSTICHLCGKEMQSVMLSKHHKRVHEQKKNYFCQHCGKGFYDKKDFKKHVQNVHESVKKGTFNCDLCSISYSHSKSLIAHKKKFHENVE